MLEEAKLPKWTKELMRFTPVQQQFLLYGNVYDFYPYYDLQIGYVSKDLENYLGDILNYNGYEVILTYVPLEGFKVLKGDENELDKHGIKFQDKKLKVLPLSNVFDTIVKLFQIRDFNSSVILNFASRVKDLSTCANDFNDFLYRTFKYSLQAIPTKVKDKSPLFNNIIFILDRQEDIPYWYIEKIRELGLFLYRNLT